VDVEDSDGFGAREHRDRTQRTPLADVLELCAIVAEVHLVVADEARLGGHVGLASGDPASGEPEIQRVRQPLLELPAEEVEVPGPAVGRVGFGRARIDEVDAADRPDVAGVDRFSKLPHHQPELVVVDDREVDALAVGDRREFLELLDGFGHRLFDQHRDAGLQDLGGDRQVGLRRGTDVDPVEFFGRYQLRDVEVGLDSVVGGPIPRGSLVEVTDRYQFRRWVAGESREVGLGDGPATDNCRLK